MKRLAALVFALPFYVCAETFIINERNGPVVDVIPKGDMLEVVCRFPGRNKFDQAINAQLNDHKSRQLFIEGLIRYFKAGPDGTMEVSGCHVLGVLDDGDYLSYTFAVPKCGCRIVPKPKLKTTVSNRVVSVAALTNRFASVASVTNGIAVVAGVTNRNAAAMCEAMMKEAMSRMTNVMLNATQKATNGENGNE